MQAVLQKRALGEAGENNVERKFEEAKKNLERFERIEQKIKPFVKKKPLILTSRFDKWKDTSVLPFYP